QGQIVRQEVRQGPRGALTVADADALAITVDQQVQLRIHVVAAVRSRVVRGHRRLAGVDAVQDRVPIAGCRGLEAGVVRSIFAVAHARTRNHHLLVDADAYLLEVIGDDRDLAVAALRRPQLNGESLATHTGERSVGPSVPAQLGELCSGARRIVAVVGEAV